MSQSSQSSQVKTDISTEVNTSSNNSSSSTMQDLMVLLSDQSKVISSLQRTIEGLNVTIEALNGKVESLEKFISNDDVNLVIDRVMDKKQNVDKSKSFVDVAGISKDYLLKTVHEKTKSQKSQKCQESSGSNKQGIVHEDLKLSGCLGEQNNRRVFIVLTLYRCNREICQCTKTKSIIIVLSFIT